MIDLPGAARPTNFDDLTYSSRPGRVLVPARDSGLYLVDPADTVPKPSNLVTSPLCG